jgi:hypothetical protein
VSDKKPTLQELLRSASVQEQHPSAHVQRAAATKLGFQVKKRKNESDERVSVRTLADQGGDRNNRIRVC